MIEDARLLVARFRLVGIVEAAIVPEVGFAPAFEPGIADGHVVDRNEKFLLEMLVVALQPPDIQGADDRFGA